MDSTSTGVSKFRETTFTGVVKRNEISVGESALHEIKAGASTLALLRSVCSRNGSLEQEPEEYSNTGNRMCHTRNEHIFILPPFRRGVERGAYQLIRFCRYVPLQHYAQNRYTFFMINIMRLDLRSPLFFIKDESLKPFVNGLANETLFCFKVLPDQAGRIDPEAGRFLGELLFGARRVSDTAVEAVALEPTAIELPAGAYLFAQEREALSQEDWLFMAMEVQEEGLWERLKLGDEVYLRCLFEDNSAVTQVFRPYWIDTVSTI
jgi:hypothetical protein